MSRVSKHEALIATLAYADVFNSALTRQELIRWFLYYPVRSVPKDFGSRAKHKKASWQSGKWMIAERASRWLSLVPTIQLVGVTGGLAMNNAGRDDDIDLFCIVADGTLWISRMLATILMDIMGLRRHPKDLRVANKVCLNMFMTEGAMKLAKPDQDCFTAHEVLQMQPLFVREDTYKRFLRANQWVKKFLPNAWREKYQVSGIRYQEKSDIGIWCLKLLEKPSRLFQLWYMQKHRTNEVITDTMLRFHPEDARVWVKRRLRVRLAAFNIPLDKIFYAR
jgi:hypothetical protein